MRTACVLTTWNRPKLVADAIASVLGQTDQDWRLYVMDDGSNEEGRAGIASALAAVSVLHVRQDFTDDQSHLGNLLSNGSLRERVVWWHGADRDLVERKRTISYSRSVNVALNFLLQDETYICYLVDDDFLYPGSIQARADYLDAHPDVHVCYGRLRAIEYDHRGFNLWGAAAPPQVGMAFPVPDGPRQMIHNGLAAKVYFSDPAMRDPQTGLPYVEEAYWSEGPTRYGYPGCIDHNQPMHRRECLTACRFTWHGVADAGGVQFWGEDRDWEVGDKAFLTLLGDVHPFYGINAWVATKRYHSFSDGVQTGAVRE